MADNKSSRDKQAHDDEKRQMKRDQDEARRRMGEPEPPIDEADLADIETQLDSLRYPATGADVVEAVGDHTVKSVSGSYTVEELVPDTDSETFESSSEIRAQVQRPTVAAAMKRIVEAADTLQHAEFGESQRDAYEKTLRELREIDADDDDEGVEVITDWIVESLHEKEKLLGSRVVRKRAAKFCRENGYEVRNDEWLGV